MKLGKNYLMRLLLNLKKKRKLLLLKQGRKRYIFCIKIFFTISKKISYFPFLAFRSNVLEVSSMSFCLLGFSEEVLFYSPCFSDGDDERPPIPGLVSI